MTKSRPINTGIRKTALASKMVLINVRFATGVETTGVSGSCLFAWLIVPYRGISKTGYQRSGAGYCWLLGYGWPMPLLCLTTVLGSNSKTRRRRDDVRVAIRASPRRRAGGLCHWCASVHCFRHAHVFATARSSALTLRAPKGPRPPPPQLSQSVRNMRRASPVLERN